MNYNLYNLSKLKLPIIIVLLIFLSIPGVSFGDDSKTNQAKFDEVYKKALKRYDEKKWTNAIEYFNKAAEIDSTKGELYIKLGHSYKKIQNYVESINAFEKAIALKHDLSYSDYFNLGYNYHNIKKYESANKYFKKAVEKNPDPPFSLYLAMATGYYNTKDYEQAVVYYQKALEKNSSLQDAYYFSGMSLGKLKKYPEAIKLMEKGQKENPNSEKVLDLLAWYLATVPVDNLRDGKRAMRLAERVVDFTSNNDPLYIETLAASYAEQGNFEKAQALQTKAVNLAISQGKNEYMVGEFKKRLESYNNKKPWRLD